MAEPIRDKLPEAIGYHSRIQLEGRSLDHWLAEHEENPAALPAALRKSGYVDSGCPEASRLLRAMSFGGPMFGVFSEDEQALFQSWIENPSQPGAVIPSRKRSGYKPPPTTPDHSTAGGQSKPRSRPDSRELFHQLLQCESPTDVPEAARHRLAWQLKRSRLLGAFGKNRLPAVYAHEGLVQYAETLHKNELARYRNRPGVPAIDRKFCRWTLLQLAPSILVDGAWLCGIVPRGEGFSAADHELFTIYRDELGDGFPERNHPNVYRRLLVEQGYDLPELESEAFARWPEFHNRAFELPVFLLSIGWLVEAYRPEVLGLNLAIELSGLGAGYLKGIDILRSHGMDPTILQLHLSIDNLACGHARRALEAIRLDLESLRKTGGPQAVQSTWQRIRVGYQSLGVVSLGLKIRIVRQYLTQKRE